MAVKPQLALAVLRRLAELTQDELAEQIGCSQVALSYWEAGTYPLSPRYAAKIIAVLKPRLSWVANEMSARGAIARGLAKRDLTQPWDELLLEHATARVHRVREEAS
jgi:DNA-binding XRE family transcriptional regulator